MKFPLGRDQVPEMIGVVLADAAYDAVASTLPKGAHGGPCSAIGANGFIQVEAAMVDRMRAMRRPSESYSEVVLKLVGLKTSDLKQAGRVGRLRSFASAQAGPA